MVRGLGREKKKKKGGKKVFIPAAQVVAGDPTLALFISEIKTTNHVSSQGKMLRSKMAIAAQVQASLCCVASFCFFAFASHVLLQIRSKFLFSITR